MLLKVLTVRVLLLFWRRGKTLERLEKASVSYHTMWNGQALH